MDQFGMEGGETWIEIGLTPCQKKYISKFYNMILKVMKQELYLKFFITKFPCLLLKKFLGITMRILQTTRE